MFYKKIVAFLLLVFCFSGVQSLSAADASRGEFGDWNVTVMDASSQKYIKLWTRIPNTSTIFEIVLNRNRGYRSYEPQDQVEVSFTRLIDPVVFKQAYASVDEVKKVGEFSLDEIIYPVGLINQDSSGELVSYVTNLPENFLDLLSASNILMFRLVSGINYTIPLNGFREALAYANSMRHDYNDPSKHPCYPLIPGNRLKADLLAR